MPRSPKVRLTRLELQLMDHLWDLGEASVREVQEAIPETSRPAYTTVQTILGRLEEKGAIRKSRKVGNAFLFVPAISRKSTYRRLVADLVETLGGSQHVVSHLVESGHLTLEDLKALERTLAGKREDS
ncbi:MAG: BlaI/MecI/CopY family transcriptional regulator [Thermoanaerobaculia bacterium]